MSDDLLRDLDKAVHKARPKESSLETQLRAYCKKQGWLCVKAPDVANFPDRIVIAKGFVAFIELKRFGEKPRPGQLKYLQHLRDLDQNAEWFDSYGALVDYLRLL